MTANTLANEALAIWTTAVEAVRPAPLVTAGLRDLPDDIRAEIESAPRLLVVGCGKAGTGMALGLEAALSHRLDRITGLVNIPEGETRIPARIRLHPARPAGSNHPTEAGVRGADEMLSLLGSAGPDDVALCLISGGGSALLPAPVEAISLEDKQQITRLLHRCGATIGEMNTVRKHLSRIKGGRLAEAFTGRRLVSLIISDVVGDPLDVIASGPTTPDTSTFADAIAVLDRYRLREQTEPRVIAYLERGVRGEIADTPKQLDGRIINRIIGSNAIALDVARREAERRGFQVLDLGPYVEGETRQVAAFVASIVRSIQSRQRPLGKPACILIGGETTVTLGSSCGKGGRNQEFVLAMLESLGREAMEGVAVLSGGTDGEDGPTDAAGAIGTVETFEKAAKQGLSLADALQRHDAYPLFAATGDLIRSGLTGTNVMDVRVILCR